MSIIQGTGIINNGAGYGSNRAGDILSGHKTGAGQWSYTNQTDGAQFSASQTSATNRAGNVWSVSRTDGSTGEQTIGDFTVMTRQGDKGSTQISVCDFDRDGYQPQA